jgi:hypothetical protein
MNGELITTAGPVLPTPVPPSIVLTSTPNPVESSQGSKLAQYDEAPLAVLESHPPKKRRMILIYPGKRRCNQPSGSSFAAAEVLSATARRITVHRFTSTEISVTPGWTGFFDWKTRGLNKLQPK